MKQDSSVPEQWSPFFEDQCKSSVQSWHKQISNIFLVFRDGKSIRYIVRNNERVEIKFE